MLDYLIRGGTIVDGSGGPPLQGDVGIVGDRIAPVGGTTRKARVVLDARGLIVAPGFIDTHAHSEFTLLADGRAEGRLCQGSTTEVNGNCGLSAAPMLGEALEHRQETLKELGITARWGSFGEYFACLEKKGMGVNSVTLCGHGNLRASVVGYRDRPAAASEMAVMKGLLLRALQEGARGLSTGLIYPPGLYATTDELVELCGVVSGFASGGLYASHMRSEGDSLIEAIAEVIRIARESGVAAHVSHLKTSGERNWHKIDDALSLLLGARNEGVEVTWDRYPYVASSSDLDSLLPPWVFDGGTGEELKRLSDPVMKQRIAAEMGERGNRYWEGVLVSSAAEPGLKWMEGASLADIAARLGKEPMETLFDILIEDRVRTGAIFFSMSERNLRRILLSPFTMIGSDSSVRSFSGVTMTGKPHPRAFGTFPRFLGTYVRDEGLTELPEAIRRIAAFPAATFGLKGRGLIREGYFADLSVFDFGRINDMATFSDPYRRPEGMVHVFVNGIPALRHGALTGNLAGRVLR